MNERDFWLALEFRVSDEFAGMPQNHLRSHWCDGFSPLEYHLDWPSPRISGRVWIVDGQKQEEWDFTLFLNHPVSSSSELDWASLLPPDNLTKWLGVDLDRKRIEVEPTAAVPDLK
jgi:hypothetical protein